MLQVISSFPNTCFVITLYYCISSLIKISTFCFLKCYTSVLETHVKVTRKPRTPTLTFRVGIKKRSMSMMPLLRSKFHILPDLTVMNQKCSVMRVLPVDCAALASKWINTVICVSYSFDDLSFIYGVNCLLSVFFFFLGLVIFIAVVQEGANHVKQPKEK